MTSHAVCGGGGNGGSEGEGEYEKGQTGSVNSVIIFLIEAFGWLRVPALVCVNLCSVVNADGTDYSHSRESLRAARRERKKI